MENREVAILLIVIVAVFIAGRIGLVDLSSVPGVGSFFAKPGVKIAVVGRASPELKGVLESEVFRVGGVTYVSDLKLELVLPGSLNSYDEVILQGEKYCEIEQRRVLSDFVKGGKKLIVVGDACTRMQSDANVLGWEAGIGGLGDVMPVKHSGVDKDSVLLEATLRIVERTHAVVSGITLQQNFTGTVSTAKPSGNSKIIALVLPQQGEGTYYGIVESSSLLAGKVVYYGFDPGLVSREMFLNMVLYLKGAKG